MTLRAYCSFHRSTKYPSYALLSYSCFFPMQVFWIEEEVYSSPGQDEVDCAEMCSSAKRPCLPENSPLDPLQSDLGRLLQSGCLSDVKIVAEDSGDFTARDSSIGYVDIEGPSPDATPCDCDDCKNQQVEQPSSSVPAHKAILSGAFNAFVSLIFVKLETNFMGLLLFQPRQKFYLIFYPMARMKPSINSFFGGKV